uniref:Uncharacterized protein n=1 Tax=Glossina austeni TaxID=7395 RepID=A0A1A9UR56_GLOAU
MDNNGNDESDNSGSSTSSSATIRNCDNNAINTLTQTNNSANNIANVNGDECMNEAKESDDEEANSTLLSRLSHALPTVLLSTRPFIVETVMLVKHCGSKLNFPNVFLIQRPDAQIEHRFN